MTRPMKHDGGISALLFVTLTVLATTIAHLVSAGDHVEQQHETGSNSAGALKTYEAVKEGIRRNKKEMCSFLLSDIDNQNEVLDLAKVTYLFESALEHLAKTSDYVTLMRPHIDRKVVDNFDKQGSSYVLEISDVRRRVMEEFEQAKSVGASDLKKRAILEKYFYIACEFKLSTIVAEKAMYESALKTEKTLRVKLFPSKG